eukprot:7824-Heterococcus_DN1.PRE.2
MDRFTLTINSEDRTQGNPTSYDVFMPDMQDVLVKDGLYRLQCSAIMGGMPSHTEPFQLQLRADGWNWQSPKLTNGFVSVMSIVPEKQCIGTVFVRVMEVAPSPVLSVKFLGAEHTRARVIPYSGGAYGTKPDTLNVHDHVSHFVFERLSLQTSFKVHMTKVSYTAWVHCGLAAAAAAAAAAACYVDECPALCQCRMLLCSTVVLDCILCLLCSSSCRSAAAAAPQTYTQWQLAVLVRYASMKYGAHVNAACPRTAARRADYSARQLLVSVEHSDPTTSDTHSASSSC